MTEAMAQVLGALGAQGRRGEVSVEGVRELSRTTYRAARAAWKVVAQPEPEI
jgi:hypothetical protein